MTRGSVMFAATLPLLSTLSACGAHPAAPPFTLADARGGRARGDGL